jgi:serine/threonine-protein kinase
VGNRQIDRYTVKRLLGQGAMGKVYLARDPKIDRQVAIKVLTPGSNDADIRERFRLEAKAIAALKHPNIVELYDYSGEDAPDLYLVMEYVPGLSLFHLVSHRGPMSEATTLCVAHELALALEHAHTHQVVHRDLKPENVLLHKGRVVLTDFGVVKAIAKDNQLGDAADKTRTQVLGTPGFMAPEQCTGRNIDARTDIFSLGAVLYNLTTGHLPFEGDAVDAMFKALRRGKYPDPREHNPLLSTPFCDLLARCLKPKPRDRWPSAAKLRARVLEILALHGVSEVRQELVKYDKNPSGYEVEQRDRALDVLVRDLKVALKDKDHDEARTLVRRMQVLAPVEDRFRDITGVSIDANQQVIFTSSGGGRGWGLLLTGMAMGTLLGLVAAVALIALRAVPASGLATLARWAGG